MYKGEFSDSNFNLLKKYQFFDKLWIFTCLQKCKFLKCYSNCFTNCYYHSNFTAGTCRKFIFFFFFLFFFFASCEPLIFQFIFTHLMTLRYFKDSEIKLVINPMLDFLLTSEAEYAFNSQKKIIPLRYEADFDIEAWLDIIIKPLIFIDVQTEQSLRDNMPQILKRLEDIGVSRWGKSLKRFFFSFACFGV